MSFWHKLETSIRKRDSLLCVGLDPQPERIPARYARCCDFQSRDHRRHGRTWPAVYKPNIAFYEALGDDGLARAARDAGRHPCRYPDPARCQAQRYRVHRRGLCPGRLRASGAWTRDGEPLPGARRRASRSWPTRTGACSCCARPPTPAPARCRIGRRAASRSIATWRAWRRTGRGGQEIGLVVGATYPEAIAEHARASPRDLVPGAGRGRAGRRAGGGAARRAARRRHGADHQLLARASSMPPTRARPRWSCATRSTRCARRRARPAGGSRCPRGACDGVAGRRDCSRRAACALAISCSTRARTRPSMSTCAAWSPIPALLARGGARLCAAACARSTTTASPRSPTPRCPSARRWRCRRAQPLIYPAPRGQGLWHARGRSRASTSAGERVVLLDDLITTGGSKLEALEPLLAEGLVRGGCGRADRPRAGRRARTWPRTACASTPCSRLRELVDALERDGQAARRRCAARARLSGEHRPEMGVQAETWPSSCLWRAAAAQPAGAGLGHLGLVRRDADARWRARGAGAVTSQVVQPGAAQGPSQPHRAGLGRRADQRRGPGQPGRGGGARDLAPGQARSWRRWACR